MNTDPKPSYTSESSQSHGGDLVDDGINCLASQSEESEDNLRIIKEQVREEIYREVTPPETESYVSPGQRDRLLRDYLLAETKYNAIERMLYTDSLSDEEKRDKWKDLHTVMGRTRGLEMKKLYFANGNNSIDNLAKTEREKLAFVQIFIMHAVTSPVPYNVILSLNRFVAEGIITESQILNTQNAIMASLKDVNNAYDGPNSTNIIPRVYDIVRFSYDRATSLENDKNESRLGGDNYTPIFLDAARNDSLRHRNGNIIYCRHNRKNIEESKPAQYRIEGEDVEVFDPDHVFQQRTRTNIHTLNNYRDLQLAQQREPNFSSVGNGLQIEPIKPQDQHDLKISREVSIVDARFGKIRSLLEGHDALIGDKKYIESVLSGDSIDKDSILLVKDLINRIPHNHLPANFNRQRILEATKLDNLFTGGKYKRKREELLRELRDFYILEENLFLENLAEEVGIPQSKDSNGIVQGRLVGLNNEEKIERIRNAFREELLPQLDFLGDLAPVLNINEGTITLAEDGKEKIERILEFTPNNYNANLGLVRQRFATVAGVVASLRHNYTYGILGSSYDEQTGEIIYREHSSSYSELVKTLNEEFMKGLAVALASYTRPEKLSEILQVAFESIANKIKDTENEEKISKGIKHALPPQTATRFLSAVGIK